MLRFPIELDLETAVKIFLEWRRENDASRHRPATPSPQTNSVPFFYQSPSKMTNLRQKDLLTGLPLLCLVSSSSL
jgi:hypothetical protein